MCKSKIGWAEKYKVMYNRITPGNIYISFINFLIKFNNLC